MKLDWRCIILVGGVVRLFLVFYSQWHDKRYYLKYTDVDYSVFTRASQYIYNNSSPYNEKTYRYTPIIAYLLIPNFFFGQLWGKFLFCVCDLLCAILMHKINAFSKVYNSKEWFYISLIWLFNPLTLTISSRGNAESLLGVFILLTAYFIKRENMVLSGMLFGLCIHLKLYPIIYTFSIYFYLIRINKFPHYLIPNLNHRKFAISCLITLLSLTTFFFHLYGWNFLNNAYLYHFHRVDIKHNFSIYFYAQYLLAGTNLSKWLGFFAFIPQFGIIFILSWRYRTKLLENWILSTIVFVTFNKVMTSQYFLWHFFLLANVLYNVDSSKLVKLAGVYLLWFASQGIWLYFAYKLEFEGQQLFFEVWFASVLLFCVHTIKIIAFCNLFKIDKVKIV